MCKPLVITHGNTHAKTPLSQRLLPLSLPSLSS
jgi:hypothetical protein